MTHIHEIHGKLVCLESDSNFIFATEKERLGVIKV